jgi:hypothetical protein
VKSTAVDARRARRAAPRWSFENSLGAATRFVRAIVDHVVLDGHGGLAELHALVLLERRVAEAIDEVALHLLEHDDASYREVGAALGISKSAAEKRYPAASSRPPGGQPGALR